MSIGKHDSAMRLHTLVSTRFRDLEHPKTLLLESGDEIKQKRDTLSVRSTIGYDASRQLRRG